MFANTLGLKCTLMSVSCREQFQSSLIKIKFILFIQQARCLKLKGDISFESHLTQTDNSKEGNSK